MKLQSETLYILSGPPASGKSTFLKSLTLENPLTGEVSPVPEDFVFSYDSLRSRFFGSSVLNSGANRFTESPLELNNELVVRTLRDILEVRMAQRLTTFVEAVLPTKAERNTLAAIARNHGMPVVVLFFGKDLSKEELLSRNSARQAAVPPGVIDKFFEAMTYASSVPHQFVSQPGAVVVDRRNLSAETAIDVICDVHGLLGPLKALLEKLGYSLSQEGVPTHPENRSLLFIGDMVDRGPDSVGVLRLVKAAVNSGRHYAVLGNHEKKLILFLESLGSSQINPAWSKANARTGFEILKLPEKERVDLVSFLKSLPGYYTQGNLVFAHADMAQRFRAMRMPLSSCVYGASTMKARVDSDTMFTEANPDYLLVRGHIPATGANPQNSRVAVVYDHGEYGGSLTALRLPRGGVSLSSDLQRLNATQVKVASGFDYEEYRKTPEAKLEADLRALVEKKLVTAAVLPESGLTLYKYAKSVFYDNLWHTSPALLRARGIVFDISGQLVQNPFTKVFNHLENGVDLDESQEIVAALKLNGYLACVSLHPQDSSRLLVTTTGSFTSDFVALAEETISLNKAKGPLLRVLRSSPERLTLMFEVIHKDDPHIVGYSPEEQGLYLIGARANEVNSLEWPEHELDTLAQSIGSSVRRGKWEVTTFGEILKKASAQGPSNVEGWMIRENTPEQKTVMKKKTSWYLTTKFLGRLSQGKAKFMFRNPEEFKKQVDEEFQGLVLRLVSSISEEEFLAMPNENRVSLVSSLLGGRTTL
jgi:predicted kinase